MRRRRWRREAADHRDTQAVSTERRSRGLRRVACRGPTSLARAEEAAEASLESGVIQLPFASSADVMEGARRLLDAIGLGEAVSEIEVRVLPVRRLCSARRPWMSGNQEKTDDQVEPVRIEMTEQNSRSSRPAGSQPAGSRPAGSRPAGSRPAGSRPAGS